MKIRFYKINDDAGNKIEIDSDTRNMLFTIKTLEKNENFTFTDGKSKKLLKNKTKNYQFLGNMLAIITNDNYRYFFEIICD